MNYKRKSSAVFDAMWGFLQMGVLKDNIPVLVNHLELLKTLMTQKSAGQRKDKQCDVSFDDIETIKDVIVIETMCLWLSGKMERLKDESKTDD